MSVNKTNQAVATSLEYCFVWGSELTLLAARVDNSSGFCLLIVSAFLQEKLKIETKQNIKAVSSEILIGFIFFDFGVLFFYHTKNIFEQE
jgi:hypothetical protein